MSEKTIGTIVTPDGDLATLQTVVLDQEEAELLRRYKKFLLKHGYKEAVRCNHCWEGGRPSGTEAHVTDAQVLIKCRCRMTFYQGQTF